MNFKNLIFAFYLFITFEIEAMSIAKVINTGHVEKRKTKFLIKYRVTKGDLKIIYKHNKFSKQISFKIKHKDKTLGQAIPILNKEDLAKIYQLFKLKYNRQKAEQMLIE